MTGQTHAELVAAAQALIAEKDTLQKAIVQQEAELAASGGLGEALVDKDGFPRSDVDIYAVRHARVELIRKQNDLTALVKRIENMLYEVHAQAKVEGLVGQPTTNTTTTTSRGPAASAASSASRVAATSSPAPTSTSTVPSATAPKPTSYLARVDGVMPDSPAFACGIRRGDSLVRFGPVNADSVARSGIPALQQIAALVQRSEDTEVVVEVERPEGNRVELKLVPKRWAGRGLLGCHIVPMN